MTQLDDAKKQNSVGCGKLGQRGDNFHIELLKAALLISRFRMSLVEEGCHMFEPKTVLFLPFSHSVM
jgi:hypothetical protein